MISQNNPETYTCSNGRYSMLPSRMLPVPSQSPQLTQPHRS
jgi:hypothetical protein